jgi:hypothetical protein
MSPRLVLIAVLSLGAQAVVAQQSAPPTTEATYHPRNLVPWRHFGPEPGDLRDVSAKPSQPDLTPVSTAPPSGDSASEPAVSSAEPAASSPNASDSVSGDPAPEAAASPAPEPSVASAVASLSAEYQKRQQDRDTRRQEIKAAGQNDPTLEAVADIEDTKLLLEGEQDRMQSSEQISTGLTRLATKLDSDSDHLRSLLKARRQTAAQADAAIAQLNAETQEMSVALKNLAMLPAGSENDEFMQRLSDRLDHLDETMRIDQRRSQQARAQLKALETDQQALGGAARQARAKAVTFDQASQDAKVNQDLLANRLEFSVERKRAADELSSIGSALQTSVNLRGSGAVQEAALGDSEPRATVTNAARRSVDDLRDCIRRSGDVTECRTSGSADSALPAVTERAVAGGQQP